MNRFQFHNIIIGWSVFLIAAVVYSLTLEPTASWWDCSEFIAGAYKLEVGHPPGAPVHIILGRFFSLFASEPSQVAYMVNLLSALASAATVMLLYWTIVHLVQKLSGPGRNTTAERIVATGSGLVGALAFAFTDSFWFSAVEGEVYALSSFFTAAVFWAILKWENEADQPHANRWLVLIAYLTGLSIGVHLLNLLAIPSIALVFYFRKYPFTWSGFVIAFVISLGILLAIQSVIIPGIPALGFICDLFFVNTLGLPFNSGLLFFILLLAGVISWAVFLTHSRKMVVANTILVSLAVIVIGYTSYGLIIIRASANTPMNQNHPDNASALFRYLNREQYGSHPLFYGPHYNSPAIAAGGEKKYYSKVDGKYVVTGTSAEKTFYAPSTKTFFPRMHSSEPNHADMYRSWGKVKGKPIKTVVDGEEYEIMKPTFFENLRFFFNYQLGHMYFRYFMWNFAGRQNDVQGHGNFMNGNWISGISSLDMPRTGPRYAMPQFMKDDPSYNKYFFLPFFFGLLGMFFHYGHSRQGKKDFTVVSALFFFTGIAIILYLNQTPLQPRERDYAYVGSFYAFAIWIGLAVPALYGAIKKWMGLVPGAILVVLVSLAWVPGVLITENWDDHDRSGRFMTRDYAINYLESCAPNAILFTYGDNDTFPLWYAQEVEGIRTDVKVINISYFGMDWNINQHRHKTYEASPIPFSFSIEKYYMGRRDVVVVADRIDGATDLRDAMAFLGSEDDRTKVETVRGQKLDFLPSLEYYLPVDKKQVLKTNTVQPEDEHLIADTIQFKIDKNFITKSEWAVLNIIAENNWERPVYINHSLINSSSIFFKDWLQLEGLAYRIVPVRTIRKDHNVGHINTSILYENVMKKFTWGNINDPGIYIDDYNRKALRIIQARPLFSRLAEALFNEEKYEMAEMVLDRMFALFPDEIIPLTFDSFAAAELYFKLGNNVKAVDKVEKIAGNSFDMLEYYISLPPNFARAVENDQDREMNILQNLLILTQRYNQDEVAGDIEFRITELIARLSGEMDS